MYITTYPRDAAEGQSMDAKEAVKLLEKSKDLNKELSKVATQYNADALEGVEHLNKFFDEHIKSLKDRIGQLEDQVKNLSSQASKSSDGMDIFNNASNAGITPDVESNGEQSKFDEPALIMASPKGIAITTPEEIHTYSDRDTILSSGKNLNIATGRSFLASIAHKFSLFVQEGAKLIAAKGKVEIQAQKNNIELSAQKTIKIVSVDDVIEITSPKEIKLNAGGSYIKITAAGIEHGTGGDWKVHSATKELVGPKAAGYKLPTFTPADSSVQVSLANVNTMKGVDSVRYTITQNSGQQFKGTLNKNGVGEKHQTDEAGASTVEYEFPDGKPAEPFAPIESLVETCKSIFKG